MIPDVCEALLEQERLGTLQILRYMDPTQGMLAWIRNAETAEIREHGVLHSDSPLVPYMRAPYPKS